MGPCAKIVVRCVLINIVTDEVVATGENICMTPVATCPRTEGEDYEKCKSVCNQVGHAEEVAACMARDNTEPLMATITGHTNYCVNCKNILTALGVVKFKVGKPI
jgi:deoxycytidylate deaminase